MAESGIFYPVVSGDDGQWQIDDFWETVYFLRFGNRSGDARHTFIRFPSVDIHEGATITSAFVRFIPYATISTVDISVNIYFNDTDNAVAPTDHNEANGLILTTALVNWVPGDWVDGVQEDSPSIVSPLQEVIDRVGWSSGNAVQVVIRDNGSDYNVRREASTIDYLSGSQKAELHVTWLTLGFTFSNPIPAHLSTTLGTTEQLQLTTTVSGKAESYTYDTSFYDDSDVQIGTTVLGINSGSPAISNTDFPTPSGIDYSWYVVVTSSGVNDTSSTYTFSNRFLYTGYVKEGITPVNRQIYLHNRNSGELVGSTTSRSIDGYFYLETTHNGIGYIVCLDDAIGVSYNDLIYGKIYPTISGGS